jgi:hypothetical protein
METRPISRPFSTTGMWRNRCAVISAISLSMVSASRQVKTVLVMQVFTGSFSTLAPARAISRTMSRSDTMPATLPSAPVMTTQPMPCLPSTSAMSSNDVSGAEVTTSLPFIFRIVATFIRVSSSPGASVPLTATFCPGLKWRARDLRADRRFQRLWKPRSFLGSGATLVEQAEKEQSAEKSADMRLPRDPAFLACDLDRA